MLALAALVTGVPQADTTAATAHAHVKPPIDFSSAQGKLHANGVPFIIKGVTWYGGEGPGDLPEGLAGPSAHNIDHYMQLLADAKFNAIRLGFNHQAVLEAKPVLHFDANVEPSLQGKRYVESLVLIVQAAARHNILVTLMCGRLTPEDVPGNGLWYSEKVPEEEVKHSWTQLARGLCGQWNVFAVDLFDEPHGTTWAGTDRSVNWHAASQRLGNHIHSLCSHWLIMVQGARSVSWETGSWYEMTPGENLMGVHEAPVRLTDMSKLVYTPHVAPPSEHMMDAYKASNFPDNMAAVWGRRFGFVSQLTGQALVMGRFGGLLADDHDADFQQAMIGWLSTHQRGYFYDCFNANPTSGGLLHKDWSRLRAEKVRLLEQVPGTDVSSLPPSPPLGTRAPIPPYHAPAGAPPPPPASEELVCLSGMRGFNLEGALDWETASTTSTTILSVYTDHWGSLLAEAEAPSANHAIRQLPKGNRLEVSFNHTLCFAAAVAERYELCFEIVDLTDMEHVRYENRGCGTLEQSSSEQTVPLNDAATFHVTARFAPLNERQSSTDNSHLIWVPVGVVVVLLAVLAALISVRKELAYRCPACAVALTQTRDRTLKRLLRAADDLGMHGLASWLESMTADQHAPLARQDRQGFPSEISLEMPSSWEEEGLATPKSGSGTAYSAQAEQGRSRVAPMASDPRERREARGQPSVLPKAQPEAAREPPSELLSSIGNILSQSDLLQQPAGNGELPMTAPVPAADPMALPPAAPPLLSPPPVAADSWSDIGASQEAPAPVAPADIAAEDDAHDDAGSVLSLGPIQGGGGAAPEGAEQDTLPRRPRPRMGASMPLSLDD